MRLLKVRMLDGTVKAVMVDDSQTVANLMVLICAKIGITNHDEYSLVWDRPRDEADEAPVPQNKFGTLGGTMTLRRTRYKDGEKEIDPKMEELKRQLNTEDGGTNHYGRLHSLPVSETDSNVSCSSELGGPQQDSPRAGHRGDGRAPPEEKVLLQRRQHRLEGPGPTESALRTGGRRLQVDTI